VLRTRARFPEHLGTKDGHYESFYIKACQPGGGRGIWIRHTVHKRPGAEPTASIWFCLFDREAEGPRATKVTVPAAELTAPVGSWIRVDGAEIGPGRTSGTIESEALNASWDLTFAGDAAPCKYLPADWLYEAPIPRTKFVAPFPNARFSGRLDIGDEAIDLDGWPGMIGHNWGSEHAERWVWLEGTGFPEDSSIYFDAGAARVQAGPWTTPWLPSGMLVLDGEAHRLGGFGQIRADDAAPWLTIIVVGHIFLPLAFLVNVDWMPVWAAMGMWAACFAGLALAILPRAKMLFIAILWQTRAPGYQPVELV